ncbi:hypothetical protein [Streptomyces sp. NPDC058371]|uniref:hypothetical protein n=1 Tax=Streptomyces sp. NPDC058371 TaxID=3346463 RepID=UPI00364984E4
MSEELRVLQAIRLKGRPTEPETAAAIGVPEGALRQPLRALVDAGLCAETRGRYQLTSAGRDLLARQVAEERDSVNQTALAAFYDRFVEHNAVVKQVITQWQLIDAGTPNDHNDPDYDAEVIGRLADVHAASAATLAGVIGLAPRLAPYPHRLAGALAKVQAGEHTWLASPLADSYHTVWFELHEDLLGLAGLARADEAAAGRAE